MRRILLSAVATALGSVPAALGQTLTDTWLSPDGYPTPYLAGPAAGDGTTLVVGAFGAGGPEAGRALVYDVTTGALTHLLPDPAVDLDGLGNEGTAVSVDVDAGRVAVGARYEDSPLVDAGIAALYDAATGLELLQLTAPDAAAGDGFGAAVALAGARLVVGAPGDDDAGGDAGSVYVFDAATGAFEAELVGSNVGATDQFGWSAAADGNLAIVATPWFGLGDKGQAWVFDVSTGTELYRLQPDVPKAGIRFGWDVDLRGTYAVVGAPQTNSVYDDESAFVFDLTTGSQLYQLKGTGPLPVDFGEAVAIDDSRVLVGARREQVAGWKHGAVYSFDLATGALESRTTDTDLAEFGRGVALADGGAYGLTGSVHAIDAAAGVVVDTLPLPDGANVDRFGWRVAVDGNRAAVSAYGDVEQGVRGPVYVVDVPTGAVTATLVDPTWNAGDQFGNALAIEGNYVAVGDPRDDKFGFERGAVVVFDATTGAVVYELGEPTVFLFGNAVDLDDGRLLVGPRPGPIRLYDVATGTLLLTIPDPVPNFGDFGWDVALDGPWIVTSTPDQNGPSGVGVAYVFDAATGGLVSTLLPSDPTGVESFGDAVAIDGTRVVVGAADVSTAGGAWVFDATTGAEIAELTSSEPDEDEFGVAVAVRGTLALVSTTEQAGGTLFGFDTETGAELFKIQPGIINFTETIAIAGDVLLAGAPADDTLGGLSGCVKVYDVPEAPAAIPYCAAKTSSAGCDAAIGGSGPGPAPTSGQADWSVTASGVQGQRTGLVIGGLTGTVVAPFQGGVLCVAPPWKRGVTRSSGGTFGACDGAFAQLVNTVPFPLGFDAGPGQTAWFQWWYRDPPNPGGPVALSDALAVPFL